MAKRRRVLRGFVTGLAILIGVVVMALLFLRTPPGGSLLRRVVLPRIDERIAGSLTVARLRWGWSRLELRGVVLRDPEGMTVAEIERLKVKVSLAALVGGRMEVRSLEIERPRVWLVQGPAGLNLTRALAPTRPAPAPRPKADDGGLAVTLDRLAVAGGVIELRDRRAGGDRLLVRVDDLVVEGAAALDSEARRASARLGLSARSRAPFAGPLWVNADLHAGEDAAVLELTLAAAGSRLDARVSAQQPFALAQSDRATAGGPPQQVDLQLRELVVEPRFGRAFLPGYPLIAPARLSGELALRGQRLTLDVELAAGGARASLAGGVHLDRRTVDDLVLRVRDVDLSRLTTAGPRSRLSFTLTADGGGRDLASLAGHASLTGPRGSLAGRPVGPVRLRVRAARERYELTELVAALPGLTLTGSGSGSRDGVNARAEIVATDLGLLRRSLEGPRPSPLPALAGRGRVRLALDGTLAAPTLSVSGGFPTLRVGETAIEGLTLDARVLNLRRPLPASADLRLVSVRAAGRSARGISARVTAGPRGALRAELRVADVLVPRPVGVSPQTLGGVALALDGRFHRGRAAGNLQGRLLGGTLAARFDLPTAWPPARDAKVALDLRALRLDLRTLLAAAGGAGGRPLGGTADLHLTLAGLAADPALTLDAGLRELVHRGRRLGELTLRVRDPHPGPLLVELTSSVFGRPAHLRLETPVVLGQLARRPPTPEALAGLPFVLRLTADALSLAPLAGRGPTAGLEGTASLDAELVGPVSALTGRVAVDVAGARGTRFPSTDVAFRAKLGDGRNGDGIEARLRVTRRQQVLAVLAGHLALPVRLLGDRAALARAPVRLDAQLGPVELQQRPSEVPPLRGQPARGLRGRVVAALALTGTPGAPRLELTARADGMRAGDTALGAANARLTYRDARAALELGVVSANGGRLVLAGRSDADLSLPALRRLDPRRVPVRATLKSTALDLAFLSGVTDSVRTVGGLLDADATLTGTLARPGLSGRLAWHGGRLLLADLGDFRDIELGLHGDGREIVLDQLSLRSGSGRARASGRAVRSEGDAAFRTELETRLDRFQIYTDGQPLGTVSLVARTSGSISPAHVVLGISIDEAQLVMASGDRKKLQPLARPADIVLVEDGEPIDSVEAKRYAALQAALERPQAPDQRPLPPDRGADAADGRRRVGAASVRLAIAAPRNLWLRGPDANLEVGLERGFTVALNQRLRMIGTVTVRRGFVKLIGRRFDLSPGASVTFSGDPARPVLDLQATYRAEKADTSVVVRVHGPTDALAFSLSSPEHPEYGDTELLAVIATGRAPSDPGPAGSTAGGKAASILGGLLADRVQKVLARRLPLDVLTIEPGEDMSGTRLEAGTYLGNDLYVAYVGRVGGEDPFHRQNRNEAHLEYQLTRRWSFEATYGDARQGSADLIWTRRY